MVRTERHLEVETLTHARLAGGRRRRRSRWHLGLLLIGAALAGLAAQNRDPGSETETAARDDQPPPETPRQFINAGTRKLHEGKLREAEALLETGLASQVERLQPVALFNLGHVRFGQGAEELKKDPAAASAGPRGRAAVAAAEAAIEDADAALADDKVQRLVAAYLHGRGARRELRAATRAVQKAMKTFGAALNRWERASGDFKSTLELNPADADARHNAEVVDQHIAKLVDSLKELQMCANALGEMKKELGDKMKQMKGRIPAPDMPPGAPGDDEEEDEQPRGPEQGQEEGPTREGEEMPISPEQAGWLLDGFRLDEGRRLPMGQETTSDPSKRDRPTW